LKNAYTPTIVSIFIFVTLKQLMVYENIILNSIFQMM